MKLKINIERLKENLLEVASVANSGTSGYNRLAFSIEEKKSLQWLMDKLHNLSLTVSQDKVGNVFGRLGPIEKPAISFGSHLDTVPDGGLYDGALGIVTALEVLQTLKESGFDSPVPLELSCFVGEEANPLGGTFGSRAVAGLIPYSEKFEEKLKSFNLTWDDVLSVQRKKEDFHSFLELHIEQGVLLETTKNKIGIATAIAGIQRLSVTVHGRASHSGTTPMHLRKDALLDASLLVFEVNRLAKEFNSDIVATVGEIQIFPNSANVVPGRAELTIEIRGSNSEEIKDIENQIRQWIIQNIDAEVSVSVNKSPNSLSSTVQKCIEKASKIQNAPYHYMFSGANHDANSLTSLTDVGLIFIPSKDGISHHPEEFSSWEDIEIGANVMLQSIIELTR
jgi:hydantoinase/carbamoylase family amidase